MKSQSAFDDLKKFRSEFLFPKTPRGEDAVYFVGNSLGLQPRRVRELLAQELKDWADHGVEGHFDAKTPWLSYHESVTEGLAHVVGAKPVEVVAMNTLTVNLHLMMATFFRPAGARKKILIEASSFPSDRYAVVSQILFHGGDPSRDLIEVSGSTEAIIDRIEKEGESLALVLIGNVNYLSGEAFGVKPIVEAGHRVGAKVGFDFAHGVGNLKLELHNDGPDFAVWCSYKYLNSGPGAVGGCFVHERHASGPRSQLAGWWGHEKASRFKMGPDFAPIPGAEGWQLSNPPIFSLAPLRASLDLFQSATMDRLRAKSVALTGALEAEIRDLPKGLLEIRTPNDPERRGAQLSLRVLKDPKALVKSLHAGGVFCDFREPDVIRVAPAPLYCDFEDIERFMEVLKQHAVARS